MKKSGVGLALAALFFLLLAGCAKDASEKDGDAGFPREIVMPRDQYDMSRPLIDLVKPHFFAQSPKGELVPVQGEPDLITEWQGRVKIRLRQGSRYYYLDPLALEPELLGEHPIHKIFRLKAMGIPVEKGLDKKLSSTSFSNELFHTLEFEYLPEKKTRGVISEVFHDGTFLVVLFQAPPEWQSSDKGVAVPTHFHVDPRALSVEDSELAKEFEKEILALPFDVQRYPASPLARKECGIYKNSRQDKEYLSALEDVGYRFTAAHVAPTPESGDPSVGETFSTVLSKGSGDWGTYFGAEAYWVADRLIDLKVPWIENCDTAGPVLRFKAKDGIAEDFYVTIRRSLEPDRTQRYRILYMAQDGSSQVIYTAPGGILMALPLPNDDRYWLMSTEGWKAPEVGTPPEPRWQSVYLVDVTHTDSFNVVDYPLSQYPKPPAGGSLYGISPFLSSDRRFLFNVLYGFKEEGGGLWVTDLSEEGFYSESDKFARIVAWDHALSWIVLESQKDAPIPYMAILMTGKEVSDDYAMTANLLMIENRGLDSAILYKERLLRMVGWNPVPFAWQRVSEHQFNVGVETHYNYESSLLPRAKGVYFLSADTTRGLDK